MPKLISVTPKEGFKLALVYDDGLEGEYSCEYLLQQEGFRSLKDLEIFNKVEIDPTTNDICWGRDMYLCKNALYKHLDLQRLMKVFKIDIEKT